MNAINNHPGLSATSNLLLFSFLPAWGYNLNVQWWSNSIARKTKTNSKFPRLHAVYQQIWIIIHSLLFAFSASNIATKVNAKLSTVYDKAISWTSSCDDGNELPWGKWNLCKSCLTIPVSSSPHNSQLLAWKLVKRLLLWLELGSCMVSGEI